MALPNIIYLSVIYGALIALIPDSRFADYDAYLMYANNELSLFRLQQLLELPIWTLLINEPIWLLINLAVSNYLDPAVVVLLITFVSSAGICFVVLKRFNSSLILKFVVVFLPAVFTTNLIHIRQSLAILCFLLAFYSTKKSIRYVLFAVSAMIHVSMLLFVMIVLYNYLISKYKIKPWIEVILYFVFCITFTLTVISIASEVGLRQAEDYDNAGAPTSGLGFIMWSYVLFLFITSEINSIKKYKFSIQVLLIYLCGYFFIPFVVRLFESMIILILSDGLKLKQNWIIKALIIYYFFSGWLLKYQMPLLGFSND